MSKMNNFFNDFDSFFNDFDGLFNRNYKPLRIKGDIKNEEGVDENGKWSKQTISSKDGSFQIVSFYRTSDKTNSNTSSNVNQLKMELEKCVELQEYEKAAELRDKIKLIENQSQIISNLENELNECVKIQNFERAIEIRDELKKLK